MTDTKDKYIEAKIIVPKVYNNGNPVAGKDLNSFRDMLLDFFGGFTETNVRGAWKDPKTGTVYRENNLLFIVALSDTLIERAKLRGLARAMGTRFGQKSVYIAFNSGVSVEFLDTDAGIDDLALSIGSRIARHFNTPEGK